jgi:tripartite-type tricarboxylate transporter receptor subunit TctC
MLKQFISRVVFLALVAAAPHAHADAVSDFFSGKTVTIYVGYGVGGGYDAYAQLVARFIGAHVPGRPTFVVKYMPGADSVVLMNWLANVAPADGTAFGIIGDGVPVAPLIGSAEQKSISKFDALKMTWLGSLENFTPIGIAWHTSDFTKLDDVKTRELKFASGGAASGGEIYSKLLNETIGTKFKPIRGYVGSAELTLAMERGEVDGMVGWCWVCLKADKPSYVKDKLVNVLVQFGVEPDPELAAAGVPNAIDLLQTEQEKQVLRLILGSLAWSRPFVAPPNMPAERAAALRNALEETARDPAFLAAAATGGRDVELFTGGQIDDLLHEMYRMPKDVIERAVELSAP